MKAAKVDAEKALWRRWASAVSVAPDIGTSEAVRGHLRELLATTPGQVLAYRSMPHELDLHPLVEAIGAHRFLTTRTPTTGPLTIHAYDEPTERHRYGFLQPTAGSEEVAPTDIAAILVPGVLFGRDGSRLGHGKGYYDRVFATCRPDVVRVGVVTSDRIVAAVPTGPHDVAMTHIASELGISEISTTTST